MIQLDLGTPWGVTVALLPEILLSGWALVGPAGRELAASRPPRTAAWRDG